MSKSKADLLYEEIYTNPDKADAMIDFLRKEAHALIVFKLLLDQCVDDDAYNHRLHLLLYHADNIRRAKLLLIGRQIHFWELTKKDYFKRIIQDIEKKR